MISVHRSIVDVRGLSLGLALLQLLVEFHVVAQLLLFLANGVEHVDDAALRLVSAHDALIQIADAEDDLADFGLPFVVFVELALNFRLQRNVFFVEVVDALFEFLDSRRVREDVVAVLRS